MPDDERRALLQQLSQETRFIEMYPLRTLKQIELRVTDTHEKLEAVLQLKNLITEAAEEAFEWAVFLIKQFSSPEEAFEKLSLEDLEGIQDAFRFIEAVYHVPLSEETLANPITRLYYRDAPHVDTPVLDPSVPDEVRAEWMLRDLRAMQMHAFIENAISIKRAKQEPLAEQEGGSGI